MATKHAKPGDPVELGFCMSDGMEMDTRAGRLVGIRKGEDVRPMERYIIRAYKEGDGEYPTGRYYTTWLLVPHDDKYGCP